MTSAGFCSSLFRVDGRRIRPSSPSRQRSNEDGFVLIGVIWGLLLIALICGPLIAIGREFRLVSRNLEARVQTRMQAEAALSLVTAALVNDQVPSSWKLDGSYGDLPVPGGLAAISIWDDAGRINLNRAGEALLLDLLLSVGMAEATAAEVAAAIVYWRTPFNPSLPDPFAELHNRGISVLPRYRAFESVDDLLLVPGMTAPILQGIRPAITTFSNLPAVDADVAPPLVKRALRRSGQAEASDTSPAPPRPTGGRTFTILAATQHPAGARVLLETTIRVTPDGNPPFLVMAYREAPDALLPEGGRE